MPTKIEWTQETWNPVTGCTKVSPGCEHCYAERMANRLQKMGQSKYANGFKVTLHPDVLDDPLHWKKPRNIFVCSMSDLFHEDVPGEFVYQVLRIAERCPQHTLQILTKRAKRMAWFCDSPDMPTNIWLGVTAEDQQRADERIPYLLNTPAAVKFLSLEPLLGPIDLSYDGLFIECPTCHGTSEITDPQHPAHPNQTGDGVDQNWCMDCNSGDPRVVVGIDWVIVGGESGPKRREMKLQWVRDIVAQCQTAGVAVFVKQLHIDGKLVKDIEQFPEDLQIREYPNATKT